ncbi:MAG: hypothetical protein FWG47_08690, partial [Propionibacteriaceae bacterium]|nr:hypothetical protein [Propionibacteriaceae bacterium]
MKLRVLAGVAAAGLLSACAVQPPGVLATPTLVPTPTSSTSPTFTPTPTPVETAPETPVETTTPTPIPTTNGQILLGGNHLGNFKFEAGETEVMSWLRAELGEPTDIFEDPFCYFTEKTPYSLQATWGGLTVVFLAKDSEPTSPRTLQA